MHVVRFGGYRQLVSWYPLLSARQKGESPGIASRPQSLPQQGILHRRGESGNRNFDGVSLFVCLIGLIPHSRNITRPVFPQASLLPPSNIYDYK